MKNVALDYGGIMQLYIERVDRAPDAAVDGQLLGDDVACDLCALADHDV